MTNIKNTKIVTERIDDHSYVVELRGSTLFVENTYYPMPGWGNFTSNWYKVRLSTKRGIIETGNTRDNWNGTGCDNYGKSFISKTDATNFINKAKAVLGQEDSDDAEYEAMELVKEIEESLSDPEY